MGPTTATVAEPVLFLQPNFAGAQELETNGSWASAGALCAGAAVAAGAVAYASAQQKSTVRTPTHSEQRAALRAARHADLEMSVDGKAFIAQRKVAPRAKDLVMLFGGKSDEKVTQAEVFAAQQAWGAAIANISKTYKRGGDYVEAAAEAAEELYGYGHSR